MRIVFWISAALIVYTYAGFPLLLRVLARLRPKPVRKATYQPAVTVLLAVHNEERVLEEKLHNMFNRYEYPQELLQFVIVSDGSNDGTNPILRSVTDPRARVLIRDQREGKAAAITAGMQVATGELVMFTDARQVVDPGALRILASNFADPIIGCVSGSLHFRQGEGPLHGEVMKMDMENRIRELEGITGSTVGVLGALYAARRELLKPVPRGTILDDCYTPLSIVHQGYRCVLDNDAKAWDRIALTPKQEFNRKVRTITGLYQLMRLLPWLVNPFNSMFWRFFSHKICRLLLPFAHAALLVSAALCAGGFYHAIFILQIVLLCLALIAPLVPKGNFISRVADVPLTIAILNLAATIALVKFVTGRKIVWAGA